MAGAPAGLSERSQGALPRSDDLGAGAAADLGAGIGAAGLGAAGSGADGVGAATGAAFDCVELALEDAGAAGTRVAGPQMPQPVQMENAPHVEEPACHPIRT